MLKVYGYDSKIVNLKYNVDSIDPNGFYAVDFDGEFIWEHRGSIDDEWYGCRGSELLTNMKQFKDFALVDEPIQK